MNKYACFFTPQMFKLNENFEADRRILKYDYIRYSHMRTVMIYG